MTEAAAPVRVSVDSLSSASYPVPTQASIEFETPSLHSTFPRSRDRLKGAGFRLP